MAQTVSGVTLDHPEATKVLLLGIVGLAVCQILSPFAWVMGNRVIKEIDASPSTYSNRGSVNVGRICGMVGTILGLVFVGLYIVLIGILLAGRDANAVGALG